MALRPAADEARTLAATFPTTSAAGAAVAAVVAAGCLPSLLEIIDGTTLRAIESLKPLGTPAGAAALLLAQCDTGDRAGAEERADLLASGSRLHPVAASAAGSVTRRPYRAGGAPRWC